MLNVFRKHKEIPAEADFRKSTGDETVIMLGRYAGSLLKNPALDAAFHKIEADIFNAWKTSAQKDAEARERMYYRMEAVAELKVKLRGMVNNMLYEVNKQKNKPGQA